MPAKARMHSSMMKVGHFNVEVEPPKKTLPKPSKLSSVSFASDSKTAIDTDVPQAPSPISAHSKRNRISSISTSQPEIAVTTLTVTKPDNKKENGGYKTWSAKPGTLIANMLMAAGIFFLIQGVIT